MSRNRPLDVVSRYSNPKKVGSTHVAFGFLIGLVSLDFGLSAVSIASEAVCRFLAEIAENDLFQSFSRGLQGSCCVLNEIIRSIKCVACAIASHFVFVRPLAERRGSRMTAHAQ
jgi:hypothetical protein